MKNRYQEKLQKQIFVFTVLLIVVSIVLFSSALFLYADNVNKDKLHQSKTKLYSFVDQTYAAYKKQLNDSMFEQGSIAFLKADEEERQQQETKVYKNFYDFNSFATVKSNLILSDTNFQIVFHTFQDPVLETSLLTFNKTVTMRIQEPQEITSGSTIAKGGQRQFMMAKGLYEDGVLVGYASYYLNPDDFNYQLAKLPSDGAIMDHFGNVIAISNASFVSGALSRVNPEYMKEQFTLDNMNYITSLQSYPEQEIQLLSIVAVENNRNQIVLGTVIIVFMGGGLLLFARYFSRQLSKKMSNSVFLLCNEIDEIKQGNLDHQIVLKTNDEFEKIADNMNEMITEIKNLTNRNAELNYASKISEIKQLEAQFHPHFLYNTLETIRYSILMDTGVGSDMIIKLTKILRYSINEGTDKVSLQKDLEFTQLFFAIEKYRFKERFTYDVDVSPECLQQIVPKLMLQPLIENSIKNGFKHKDSLHIHISGRMFGKVMKLWVEDDGIGILPDDLIDIREKLLNVKNETNHHGLFNTNRRLYLQYGEGSQLEIFSEYQKKTTVIVTILLKEEA